MVERTNRYSNVIVEEFSGRPVSQQRTEIVERKELGHPDSICYAVHERIDRRIS